MRLVSGLALAVVAAVALLACGETQEVIQSESPGATTPAASATPTAGPVAADTPTATAAPASDTPTPTPTSAVSLSIYEDAEHGFSLKYPTGWTVSEPALSPDDAELDILGRFEFTGKDGLPHLRLVVGDNAEGLSLADWVKDHDAIFFDTDPQQVLIDGLPALYQPLSLGLPSPRAWVAFDSRVLGIFGLTPEDHEIVIETIQVDSIP